MSDIPARTKGRFGALFCLLAALAMCAPTASIAQKNPRIGVTLAGSAPSRYGEALAVGLAEHGWVHGKNITIEYHYAEGRTDRYAAFMQRLAKSRVDLIVAGGGTLAAEAALRVTKTIPVVTPAVSDPVGVRLVQSLARPGGNLTGLSIISAEFSGKRLELLREAFPKVRRIAALRDTAIKDDQQQATERAAKSLGIELHVLPVSTTDDFAAAFDKATRLRAEGLLVFTSAFLATHRSKLVQLVRDHKLIGIYDTREYVEAGGLISYGVDVADSYRAAARYVDRILKGANPADLPIEQPRKFELLVNLQAAKALGLEFPRSIVMRADQIID